MPELPRFEWPAGQRVSLYNLLAGPTAADGTWRRADPHSAACHVLDCTWGTVACFLACQVQRQLGASAARSAASAVVRARLQTPWQCWLRTPTPPVCCWITSCGNQDAHGLPSPAIQQLAKEVALPLLCLRRTRSGAACESTTVTYRQMSRCGCSVTHLPLCGCRQGSSSQTETPKPPPPNSTTGRALDCAAWHCKAAIATLLRACSQRTCTRAPGQYALRACRDTASHLIKQ